MSKTNIPQKGLKVKRGARPMMSLDPFSLTFCFNCHLPDCAGELHPACPIYQARARRNMPPTSAAPIPLGLMQQGRPS